MLSEWCTMRLQSACTDSKDKGNEYLLVARSDHTWLFLRK